MLDYALRTHAGGMPFESVRQNSYAMCSVNESIMIRNVFVYCRRWVEACSMLNSVVVLGSSS